MRENLEAHFCDGNPDCERCMPDLSFLVPRDAAPVKLTVGQNTTAVIGWLSAPEALADLLQAVTNELREIQSAPVVEVATDARD